MAINEAAALGDAIKAAALRGKSLLVEASVQVREDGTMPIVILNSDDAVKIIDAQAPRMVYLVEQVFDLAGEIEMLLQELCDIGVERSPSDLKATERRFVLFDGQIGAAIVSFMVDGILHTAIATAAWHDEFSDAIEAVLEDARESSRVEHFSKHSDEAKAVESDAMVLLRHPSFNHGRVSFDKRMALAETLFRDCTPDRLSEITRRAETLFWLEQSGVTLAESDQT